MRSTESYSRLSEHFGVVPSLPGSWYSTVRSDDSSESFVISLGMRMRGIVAVRMSHSPNLYPIQRAPRVKLAGSVLVLLQLENQRQLRARLHQLSVTGGLLQLDEPLDDEAAVEMMFHVGSTTVRAKAQTISPVWATQGYLQPFRFTAFHDDDRLKLESDLHAHFGIHRVLEGETVSTVQAEVESEEDVLDPQDQASEVRLYFENPQDAMHFTVALSAVIFSDSRASREEVTKLAREITKVSRVTTRGVLKPKDNDDGAVLLSAMA